MRNFTFVGVLLALGGGLPCHGAFSGEGGGGGGGGGGKEVGPSASSMRRAFLVKTMTTTTIATASVLLGPGLSKQDGSMIASAASSSSSPTILNTPSGIKYAVTGQPADPQRAVSPQLGDIVAIEYTGYFTDGSIFDATHAEGKRNALLFKLGSDVVIPGLNEMVGDMCVGQKVQAIMPSKLAFGEKGLCLEDGDARGECLIKPGQTLVYDIYLKKSTIPPP